MFIDFGTILFWYWDIFLFFILICQVDIKENSLFLAWPWQWVWIHKQMIMNEIVFKYGSRFSLLLQQTQGRIQNFKLGGAQLKNLHRAEGGAESFGVFRVKNHNFMPKKSYFFQLRREARKFLGYFVWKITILCQKIIFFPIDLPLKPTLCMTPCTVGSSKKYSL